MTRRAAPVGWLKVLGLGFTVAALGFAVLLAVSQGDRLLAQWGELRDAGWGLRPGWLLAALGAATANLFLLGGAWILLLRSLGGALGYHEGMRAWTWTNLGRYLPGRLWQISALTLYLREKRRIGGIGLGSNLTLQVLLLAVGAGVAFAVLGVELAAGRAAIIAAAGVAGLAGLALALRPSAVARVSSWMAGWMGEPEPVARPRRGALWEATGLVALSWLVNGLSLWLLWRGVGAGSGPGVWFWTGAFAAAYLVGYAALFAPAGLVVRELSLATVLVGLAGVPAAAAAGIAVLSRLLAVASELLAAALVWGWPAERPADDGNAGEGRGTENPAAIVDDRRESMT